MAIYSEDFAYVKVLMQLGDLFSIPFIPCTNSFLKFLKLWVFLRAPSIMTPTWICHKTLNFGRKMLKHCRHRIIGMKQVVWQFFIIPWQFIVKTTVCIYVLMQLCDLSGAPFIPHASSFFLNILKLWVSEKYKYIIYIYVCVHIYIILFYIYIYISNIC